MNKRTYYATVDGYINGAMRKAGEAVGKLTDRDAKYLIMSGLVTAEAPKSDKARERPLRAEPSPTSLGKKTR